MPQSYTLEFKKKIVRLHEEEGRTYKSITAEYGVSKASISKWCREFSEECQAKALENSDVNIPVLISINPLADWHSFVLPYTPKGFVSQSSRQGIFLSP